jgi:transposase
MTTMMTVLDRSPGIADPGRVDDAGAARPDPEVPERARRRTFTAQYKLAVLAAYDAAPEGEKGAILRREGLYSSHIVDWCRRSWNFRSLDHRNSLGEWIFGGRVEASALAG